MSGRSNILSKGIQKSILIFQFLFLTSALLIAWNTPAVGFESSIYNSTPLILWIALISSVIVGITIVITSVSNSQVPDNNVWKSGIFLIFLSFAICLGLFIIRGYYMWGIDGDPASHIGWTNEILNNGYVPTDVFYPITHIFLAEINLLTTLDLVFLHKMLPLFFGLLFAGFMYLFVREISTNQIEPIIAGIISCTFITGWFLNLTPNLLANLLIPFALFLLFRYLKSNNSSWTVSLFIILLLLPVFHPLPAVFVGLVMIALWIPQKLQDFWRLLAEKNHDIFSLKRMNPKLVRPFLFLLTWFVFWYSLYYIWGYSIYQVYNKITSEEAPSKFTNLASQISYAQGYGYNVLEIFLKQYGHLLLLYLLSLVALVLVWRSVSRDQKLESIFSLYGPWALLTVFIPALYVVNLTFSPLRMLFYHAILETVFVAFLLSYLLLLSREAGGRFKVYLTNTVVIIVIAGLFLSGLLNLYPSPYTLTKNFQTTQSEVSGAMFFFEYRNISVPVSGLDLHLARFADLLLTPKEKHDQHLSAAQARNGTIPWHFGYNQFPSIGMLYDVKTDLILKQSDRAMYTDYFPDMAKYRIVPLDFERLENDPTVSFIYSNGGYNILTIVPENR